MEIKGKVLQVMPAREGVSKAGKPWKALTVVIEIPDDRYPKKVAVELFGEAIDRNPVQAGQEVTAHCDLESREWKDKNGATNWSTTCRAYRIDAAQPAPQQGYCPPPPQPQQGYYPPQQQSDPYSQYQQLARQPYQRPAQQPAPITEDLPF